MRGSKILKNCLLCYIEYKVPKCRENSKYCSTDCRIKAQSTELNITRNRKIIECLHCGEKKEIHNYQKDKFCSISCSAKHQKRDNNKIKKKCINCDKEYEIFKYRSNSNFCSTKCYNLNRNDVIICPSCNITFSSPKYEKRKYCSNICSDKGVEKRKSALFLQVFNYLNTIVNTIEYEVPIKRDGKSYSVDIMVNNKIIECYGDYWHCNPIKYDATYYHSKIRKTANEIWDYDFNRNNYINNLGYEILIVWENDWFNNIENTKKEIKKFLL